MDVFKKIIKSVSIIALGIAIGFGGSWFYTRYIIKFNLHLDGNLLSEQSFSVRSDISSVAYPFRNWQVREEPSVQAEGVLMVDLDTDFVFYQRQPNFRRPIASITKLMTAVIVQKYLSEEDEITISQRALNVDGDLPLFYLNEKVKIADLIKALLMISSNKAAAALSFYMGEDKFVELMNNLAKELEMTQTTFVEPTGLNFLNQSTPSDLKKLMKYILNEYPNLLLISKNNEDSIQGIIPKTTHRLININLLTQKPVFLEELGLVYLGGKTGFTDEAWQTFCGVFLVPSKKIEEQPKRILVVVLKTPTRYNDIESLLRWLNKAYVF